MDFATTQMGKFFETRFRNLRKYFTDLLLRKMHSLQTWHVKTLSSELVCSYLCEYKVPLDWRVGYTSQKVSLMLRQDAYRKTIKKKLFNCSSISLSDIKWEFWMHAASGWSCCARLERTTKGLHWIVWLMDKMGKMYPTISISTYFNHTAGNVHVYICKQYKYVYIYIHIYVCVYLGILNSSIIHTIYTACAMFTIFTVYTKNSTHTRAY